MKSKKSTVMVLSLILAVLAAVAPVSAAEAIYFECTAWAYCFGVLIYCQVECVGSAAGCGFSLGDTECSVWCWCSGSGTVGGGAII